MLLGSLIQMFRKFHCSSATEDGAFYVLGTPENAIAGDDLRVLIAESPLQIGR